MVTKTGGILLALGSLYALLTPEERRRIGTALKGRSNDSRRFGLVHRLPKNAADHLETEIMPLVRSRLIELGLQAEVMTFDLPHIPVIGLTGPVPLPLLKALPRYGRTMRVDLTGAHILRASDAADADWSLRLDCVGDIDGHCTLVHSRSPVSSATRAALALLAEEVDAVGSGTVEAELRDVSLVEFGPLGNAVRELYRASLEDGRVWDVATGQEVSI